MFKIFDRRGMFYQWDLDRKLIVLDNSISMVHFSNGLSDTTLDCETYRDGDITLVNVPNILLQQAARITAFAYDDNHTKYSTVFAVIDRPKPADYIYTETEVKNYEKLKNLVYRNNDDLIHLKDEFQNYYDDYSHTQMSVASIEDDYYRFVRPQLEAHTAAIEELKENGVAVDLTGYYTKEEVENLIKASKVEKPIELIESITLTEDLEVVVRTQDTNGNPYNFEKLIVKMANAKANADGAVNILINNGLNVLTVPEAISSTGIQYSTGTIWAENQTLFYQSTRGIKLPYNTTNINGMAYARPVKVDNAIIQRIEITAVGTVLTSGSKIEIWGVRADV